MSKEFKGYVINDTDWKGWGKAWSDKMPFDQWFDSLTEDEKFQVELMKEVVMSTEYDALDGDAAEIVYELWKVGFRLTQT